ncbi:electron transport complex subunit RsxD [Glaciecola sp. XM2]|jgi:electron transport complex protein RnfD|uniref:electron transport complex subunit RsxD n=1 Tax=Glaciecola sp. XM2 TaxID=1914931 RepID=UPI001BDEB20C|nr:electron transport complex subunit RsxD [Glaciecola sp. XM2]MBT1450930.1 electron transport complex subunit RsxD [Glaciecola sp. XM2]
MSKLSVGSSPHHHNQRDTGAVMRLVMYACIPGILMQTWFFGVGVLIQIALCMVTAVVTEALIVELRKKNTERVIKDSSAALAGLLLGISIPPLAPWWIAVIGSFFAIALVKQVYGGLGFNMFNPAMAAYIMLLISFPVQMTAWLPPVSLTEQSFTFIDALNTVFTGFTTDGYSIEQLRVGYDGLSMATPLDHLKTQLIEGYTVGEALSSPIMSGNWGLGWTPVALAYLAGGLLLLKLRVINWHIPVSMIGAAMATSFVLFAADSSVYGSPAFHLINGSLIVGAFFIATDPVSAATTNRGRLIFGAAIGFWIIVIRTWGNYPDAVAFAVVLMNMAVPLIDYYTRPRTYGHKAKTSSIHNNEEP